MDSALPIANEGEDKHVGILITALNLSGYRVSMLDCAKGVALAISRITASVIKTIGVLRIPPVVPSPLVILILTVQQGLDEDRIQEKFLTHLRLAMFRGAVGPRSAGPRSADT